MTDRDHDETLRALIAKWRVESARLHREAYGDAPARGFARCHTPDGWRLLKCADELEAALRVSVDRPQALIEDVIRQVAELPDRTSPDDWQEAMIVTAYELRSILEAALLPVDRPRGHKRESLRGAEEMAHAAKLLALSVPDSVIDALRPEWGNTNVAVIAYWREQVLAALHAYEQEQAAPTRVDEGQPENKRRPTAASNETGPPCPMDGTCFVVARELEDARRTIEVFRTTAQETRVDKELE